MDGVISLSSFSIFCYLHIIIIIVFELLIVKCSFYARYIIFI